MAAAAQKMVNFNITRGTLHSAVLNPQGSKTFVKKIVPVALSFILHQRMESIGADFDTRTYDGIEYKVLKSSVRNPVLREVQNWIKGALDALDKNYLRQLYLVLASKEDPNLIYETYKFQFQYMGDDVIQFDKEATEEELKQSTSEILKAIESLQEYKMYNEKELVLKMALTYYDDVTPPEYKPPFYNHEADDGETFFRALDLQPRNYLHLGFLKAGFHIVKCRAKGEAFSVNQFLSSTNLAEAASSDVAMLGSEQQLDVQQNEIMNIEEFTVVESTLVSKHNDILRTAVTPTISEFSENFNLTEEKIRCMCKMSGMFSQIDSVLCSKCCLYQHCVCVGYLQQSDVSDTYVCPYCDDNVFCTPKTEETNKELSIYKLAIGFAYLTNTFPKDILDQLTVDKKCIVTEKLKKLNIIYEEDGDYKVNKHVIERNCLEKLFGNTYKNMVIPDSMSLRSSEKPKKRRKVLQGKSSSKRSALK